MYDIELSQNFASDLNEKRHQVALLVRKAESQHENENIFTKSHFVVFKVYSVRTSKLTSKLLKSYSVDNF